MTLKYLPALALLASLAAVAPAAAQQQTCDNNRSTPTTDDDCPPVGFLLPGGLNAGVAAAGVVGVAALGSLLGDDSGPATFTTPATVAFN